MHAESIDVTLHAFYSVPGRPLQFGYNKASMVCQFTLMTAGDYRGDSTEALERLKAPPPQSRAPTPRSEPTKTMAPPPRPISGRRSTTQLGTRRDAERANSTATNASEESLFVSQDDRSWYPAKYNADDDGEERIGWDTSAVTVRLVLRRRCRELMEDRNLCMLGNSVNEILRLQKLPGNLLLLQQW